MLQRAASPCKLLCVDPLGVRHAWPHVKALIDRAYAEVDSEIPADLFNRLCDGRALLWMVYDDATIVYAFVTELYVRRSGTKVCRLVAGAGARMDEWLHLQSEVEAYARAEGCAKIVAEGRAGWQRALTGYKEIRRVIEKDL